MNAAPDREAATSRGCCSPPSRAHRSRPPPWRPGRRAPARAARRAGPVHVVHAALLRRGHPSRGVSASSGGSCWAACCRTRVAATAAGRRTQILQTPYCRETFGTVERYDEHLDRHRTRAAEVIDVRGGRSRGHLRWHDGSWCRPRTMRPGARGVGRLRSPGRTARSSEVGPGERGGSWGASKAAQRAHDPGGIRRGRVRPFGCPGRRPGSRRARARGQRVRERARSSAGLGRDALLRVDRRLLGPQHPQHALVRAASGPTSPRRPRAAPCRPAAPAPGSTGRRRSCGFGLSDEHDVARLGEQHRARRVEADRPHQRPQHRRVELHARRPEQVLQPLERACAAAGGRRGARSSRRSSPPPRRCATSSPAPTRARPRGSRCGRSSCGARGRPASRRASAWRAPACGTSSSRPRSGGGACSSTRRRVSRAGLRSTSPGTAILPMSCSRPATPRSASAWRGSPSDLAHAHREHAHVHAVGVGVLVVLLERGQPDDRVLVPHDAVHDRLHQRAWPAAGRAGRSARRAAGCCLVPSTARQNTFFARPRSRPAPGSSSSSRREVLLVQLARGQRHDVLDAGLRDRLGQALGQRRVLGRHEELEEALELGRRDARAGSARRPATRRSNSAEQRVVDRQQRRRWPARARRSGRSSRRPRPARPRPPPPCARWSDREEVLQLAPERLVRHVVRARGAQQRGSAPGAAAPELGEAGALVPSLRPLRALRPAPSVHRGRREQRLAAGLAHRRAASSAPRAPAPPAPAACRCARCSAPPPGGAPPGSRENQLPLCSSGLELRRGSRRRRWRRAPSRSPAAPRAGAASNSGRQQGRSSSARSRGSRARPRAGAAPSRTCACRRPSSMREQQRPREARV